MTLLTEIQAAQFLLKLPFASKRILMRVPVEIVEIFNPEKRSLWMLDPARYNEDDSDNYVYLRLFPTYIPEDEALGEVGYKFTFSRAATANVVNLRRGFNASVRQSQKWIYDVVERTTRISNSTFYKVHTPIKIIDFCRPEARDDNKTFYIDGEWATIRWGRVSIGKPPAFIKGLDGFDYCQQPWDFKFMEAILRSA